MRVYFLFNVDKQQLLYIYFFFFSHTRGKALRMIVTWSTASVQSKISQRWMNSKITSFSYLMDWHQMLELIKLIFHAFKIFSCQLLLFMSCKNADILYITILLIALL